MQSQQVFTEILPNPNPPLTNIDSPPNQTSEAGFPHYPRAFNNLRFRTFAPKDKMLKNSSINRTASATPSGSARMAAPNSAAFWRISGDCIWCRAAAIVSTLSLGRGMGYGPTPNCCPSPRVSMVGMMIFIWGAMQRLRRSNSRYRIGASVTACLFFAKENTLPAI